MMLKQIRAAVVMVVLFTAITGLIYPLAITGAAQLIFPEKANGSLMKKNGRIAGSELIGQPFSDPKYFWSRPSATSPFPYNAAASSGSNFGPLNPGLLTGVQKQIQELKKTDPLNAQPIPVDLVTASASGLDPHISIAAALYQVPRVARIRGISEDRVRTLVDRCTEGRGLGVLGEPRVHVLKLNLDPDGSQNRSEVQ